MATAVMAAAVSFPSSSAASAVVKASPTSPCTAPHFLSYRPRSARAAIRAQASATDTAVEAPAKSKKESKKQEEGVVTNLYKPKEPYIGKCLLNTKITGDDAPGETWHMVFSTEGKIPYREGQSIGIIADGVDKSGKPHKLRLYSIASSALGDFGDSKTVSLCVKRLVYTNEAGEIVKGVCSNFLCDLKPGADVQITGPVGKEMLMPKDPNATIIMLATGTGIAPFRSFLWKMFFEKHDDYKFNGLGWLFLGVPTSSSLLYKEVANLWPLSLRGGVVMGARDDDNDSGSLISSLMVTERKSRYQGDKSAFHVIPSNATIDVLLARCVFFIDSKTLNFAACPMFLSWSFDST